MKWNGIKELYQYTNSERNIEWNSGTKQLSSQHVQREYTILQMLKLKQVKEMNLQ